MITIENEQTFRSVITNGVNLFLGAGFSVLAHNAAGQSLPLGVDLKKILIDTFKIDGVDKLDLAQICTIIESSQSAELRSLLDKTYRVVRFDSRYCALDGLAIRNIFTTNIDNLIYKALGQGTQHYLNDVSKTGPTRKDRTAINYVPLHGSIENHDSRLTFTTTDMAAAFAADTDLWHLLTNQMQSLPTLFCGYSLSDAGILQALHPQTIRGREMKDKWIVLHKSDSATVRYFQALRFNIIIAQTDELLDYFSAIKSVIATPLELNSTNKLFPSEVIPPLDDIPVRPLLDFYLGDAPTWPDIFSSRLHKTRHVAKILNSINGKINAVIIGIPACGKTTLMMQCAAEVEFHGHKLVSNSVTEDKAHFIINRLEGQPALFFIDDFSESVHAVALLMAQPNIIVMAFDREHNYENVFHFLDHDRYTPIDVTELSAMDIQDIYNRLPPEIRKHSLQHVTTQPGVLPSLFEIIEANTLRPTLKRRFVKVLSELTSFPDLLELLVMIAYVHSCRTPVSFDMLYAFSRESTTDFHQIYEQVDRLGQMLSSYAGALMDADQDHYVARSVIISEAIISQVSGPVFRRVLERFHREISPLRICRFDVFRRRAFDADFFDRAFANWREGMAFYDELYSRDQSPFLRQQGALYLAHKKRYGEAFDWIDEALLQSEGKIPSIRHTHAIVLFNANIDLSGGPEREKIRSLLDLSMEILTECHRTDKRQLYHTLTFSDQALRYWAVFGDDKAEKYLQKTFIWLTEEQKRSSWNRRLKHLVKAVSDKLRSLGK